MIAWADGIRIHFNVYGSGASLILLHDLPGSSIAWCEHGYIQDLARDFRVISLDCRGSGQSDKPKTPRSYRFECIAADIIAVADACGAASFACIGSGWGANTALRLAATNDRVTRVVSIDGAFDSATSAETRLAKAFAWWRAYIDVERMYLPEVLGLADGDLEQFRNADPLAIRAAALALESWPSVEPEQLAVPTLLITGSEDRASLKGVGPLRLRIDQAGIETRLISGLGRRATFERSDLVVPLIRSFLTRSDRGCAATRLRKAR